MNSMTDLKGKVAVITGAGSAVGLALALRAADQGMKVALADGDEHLLGAAFEHVKAKHVGAIAVRIDMSDADAVRTFARRTEFELGPPWLVCNNLGVNRFEQGGRLPSANLKSVIDLNLWSVINGVQVFAPSMVKRGTGHIVNIASAEMLSICGAVPYVATMHAIVGMSESLHRELDSMGSGVGVTVVCPALVDKNVTGVPQAERATQSAGDAPPNVLSPEELAEQIFDAVTIRRFRVSSGGQSVSVPASNTAGGLAASGCASLEGGRDEGVAFFVGLIKRKRTEQAMRERERYLEPELALADANRLARIGQLSDEVKQPISAAVTSAQAALQWLGAQPARIEEARRSIGLIVESGHRACKVIDRIRALVRGPQGRIGSRLTKRSSRSSP